MPSSCYLRLSSYVDSGYNYVTLGTGMDDSDNQPPSPPRQRTSVLVKGKEPASDSDEEEDMILASCEPDDKSEYDNWEYHHNVQAFKANFEKKLNKQKKYTPGLLSKVGIERHSFWSSEKKPDSLKDIYEHAKQKNNRTRKVCVKLGWMDKKGNLTDNAPKEMKELATSSKSYSVV